MRVQPLNVQQRMAAQALRIVVFAPHFAEYSVSLAGALSQRADVLVVTEVRNFASECAGLEIEADSPRLGHVSYAGDLAQRRVSLRGSLEGRRIRRAIKAFAPDIIHVQEQGDPFTASIVREFARACPIVLTVHDPVPHSGNDALVAQRFSADLIRIRALASAYHVHGLHCEALLRERLGTSKPIVETAHGVILVPPPGRVRQAKNRYLFFGRMEAYKGLDTLMDAIDLLSASGGPRFVLAGRGPELDRLRNRIAAHPAIELIERFLPPLDAIHQFQRARAVLVPYRDATQSGVISAAIGNGRPVIASNVGGLADAVGHGTSGLVVPPGDPAALAGAIRAMSDASTYEHLRDGAKKAATGRFAWATIATRLLDVYAEILNEEAGAGRRPDARP